MTPHLPHLQIEDFKVHYPVRKGVLRRQVGAVRAVDGVSFTVARGETFGLVGESGCGKSTLARAVLRLQEPTSGRAFFRTSEQSEPVDLVGLPAAPLQHLRAHMQIVFQDPYMSLNPRLRIGTSLGEPLRAIERLGRAARKTRIGEVLDAVGLPRAAAERFPHEFSGGQRQRIAIARALITRPGFIVLDEPVSALDVSIRAQVLNLLSDMQHERQLTYLFISHDLSVVRYLCTRLAVMYLGRIVELGPVDTVFADPRHPYTRLLLSAVPVPRPHARQAAMRLGGDPPSPLNPPPGCTFHTRCPLATDRCRTEPPELQSRGDARFSACHHAERVPTMAGNAPAMPVHA